MPNTGNMPPNDSRGSHDEFGQHSANRPILPQNLLAQMMNAQDVYQTHLSADLNPIRLEETLIGDRGAMLHGFEQNAYTQYLAQSMGGGSDIAYSYSQEENQRYYQDQDFQLHAQQYQACTPYGSLTNQQYQGYPDNQTYMDAQGSYAPSRGGIEGESFLKHRRTGEREDSHIFRALPMHHQPGPNEGYSDLNRAFQSHPHRFQNNLHLQSDNPNSHAAYAHLHQQLHHRDNNLAYMSHNQQIGSSIHRGINSHKVPSNYSTASLPSQHSMRYPDSTTTGIPYAHHLDGGGFSQETQRTPPYRMDFHMSESQFLGELNKRPKSLPMLGAVKSAMDPLMRGSPNPKNEFTKIGPIKKKKRPTRRKPKDMPRRPFSAYNLFFSEERVRILEELKTPPRREEDEEDEELGGGEDREGNKPSSLSIATDEENVNAPCAALLKPLVKTEGKRRPHRKTHGKVSFRELAVQVGARWRALPPDDRKYYQELADKDLLRHKAAMERYHEKQNKEKLGTVMVEPEEKEFHLGSSSGTEILQRSGDGHVNGVKCNENDEVPSNVPTESEQDNHMSSAGT